MMVEARRKDKPYCFRLSIFVCCCPSPRWSCGWVGRNELQWISLFCAPPGAATLDVSESQQRPSPPKAVASFPPAEPDFSRSVRLLWAWMELNKIPCEVNSRNPVRFTRTTLEMPEWPDASPIGATVRIDELVVGPCWRRFRYTSRSDLHTLHETHRRALFRPTSQPGRPLPLMPSDFSGHISNGDTEMPKDLAVLSAAKLHPPTRSSVALGICCAAA